MHGKLVECEVLELGPSKLIITCTCTCSNAIHTEGFLGWPLAPFSVFEVFPPGFGHPDLITKATSLQVILAVLQLMD